MASDASDPKSIGWEQPITVKLHEPLTPVRALTFLRRWSSASRPILLSCDDNHAYVVKGAHAQRQIVNDQIVGRLGKAMGAPVGEVALVEVPVELVESEPQLKSFHGGPRFQPGIWHGSRFITGVSEDREGYNHVGIQPNRERFALLALLFGWAHANDHQFLYAKNPPQFVWSVDHGHFFPDGPDWTVASLAQAASAQPDPEICSRCALTAEEIEAARRRLQAVEPVAAITDAVAGPLESWMLQMPERVALAQFLHQRHRDLTTAPITEYGAP